MPLANSFLESPEDFAHEPLYPLDVCFCEDCSLVQLPDVIDPEVMFRQYVYLTGISDTVAAHNVRYARDVVNLLALDKRDLVVEVASNDGSLLKCFEPYGMRTLGIEPARNVAEIARADGVDTLAEFFDSSIARQVRERYGPARVVLANNVLAHVDETRDFLSGCKNLLDESGLVIVEVPYVRQMLDQLYYDTIYHEHHCYFSVTTLMRLCDEVGLCIFRVEHLPIHGGSLRMYAGAGERLREHSADAMEFVQAESDAGLTKLARYQRFAADIENNRREIMNLLVSLGGRQKALAGYGAPAKGNVLLNYCNIGTELLPYTVDKNSLKVGLFTPGMHIPVLPVSTLLEKQPDYVLILAWNFAQEIIQQQATYREKGGQFIIPLPEPRIV